MEKKNIILIVLIGIMISGIILMYSSYALFSQNEISKSAITIKAGTMNGTIKVDGTIDTNLTVPANSSKIFTVTLENLNSEQGKFLFYYLGSIPTGVKFGYLEESGKNTPPNASGITLTKNGKQTYSLYVANTTSSTVTINLGSLGGLSNQSLSLPSNGHIIEKTSASNSNIVAVYQYDQTNASTKCITGEESTCVKINPPATYTPGTIVKYKVNSSTEKYFHVISDNGNTLTMQQRENTVYDTAWYAATNDGTKGPTTILPVLEKATNGWTNVLDQTYTLGTTVFKDNPYTGCYGTNNQISCTTNRYTLGQRKAKARLISAQEAISLGCQLEQKTCPIWMYNYLSQSTSYGGTVDQTGGQYGRNDGYWTSSVNSNQTAFAYQIFYFGFIGNVFNVSGTLVGGRAVIQIEK